ncbi:MAG: hypothetical protein M3Z09_17925 [Acidobacteriota bacterium]|nr:hypothetical protein [Acidobacteriota bacterium]
MPLPAGQRSRIQALRLELLDLHKLLLDRERGLYEKSHEAIGSPGEFLSLVLNHPQFEWLRQLSGVIVELDELLSLRTKSGPEEAAAVLATVEPMLRLKEDGTDFERRYFAAIQDSPGVVIAHCKAEKLLAAARL